MNNLVVAERNKYEDMWAVDAYNRNSPGERLVVPFVDMVGPLVQSDFNSPEKGRGHLWDPSKHSVLDAGCGAGRGMLALRKAGFFDVRGIDIVDVRLPEAQDFGFVESPLWDALKIKTDFVYCCDVLEHVPPQFTMLVIARLLEVAKRGVFLSISNVPDTYGAWVGKTLHETVQPFVWWRDNISVLGNLVEARDLLISSLFLVTP